MQEKEKQIKEMANDYYEAMLKARVTLGSMNEGAPKWYAKELYAKGYRKASDLEKEIADLKAIAEQYQKQFEEARTDGAREIFAVIDDIVESWKIEERSKETNEYIRTSYNGTMIVKCLAELKKKYLEGEDTE